MSSAQDFISFCELEVSTGGPDPQVEIAAAWALDGPVSEAAWKIGCFIGPYTLGAAAGIWGNYNRGAETLREYDGVQASLEQLLTLNWAGVPVRRERRAAWRADKLAVCLTSYMKWSDTVLPRVNDASYDELYDSVQEHVTFFGRYATMKVLETLYRAGLTASPQTDIRPDGARFPRKTIAELIGDDGLRDGNTKTKLAEVNAAASAIKDIVADAGLHLSWFSFETLLCNYRQALSGKYPGRSHDRELAHFKKAEAYWGDDIVRWQPFYTLRASLFPRACLGEIGGWDGARRELERVWGDHRYFWADTVYDYERTTDLSQPQRRLL